MANSLLISNFMCVCVFYKTRENFLATRDKTESLMNKMKDMKKVIYYFVIFIYFYLFNILYLIF